MADKILKKDENLDISLVEDLFFSFLESRFSVSRDVFFDVVLKRQDFAVSVPVSVLNNSVLSGLESIVKFLRENRSLSYDVIGKFLCRDSRSLAVTYGVARRKMPEFFSSRVDRDVVRVPFSVFSFGLSVLESVCFHLKFLGYSYVDISRLIGRDPTTVWTVCKRAEKKLGKKKNSAKHDKAIISLPSESSLKDVTTYIAGKTETATPSFNEDMFFSFLESRFSVSRDVFFDVVLKRQDFAVSVPVSVLNNSVLSGLESIVKFLRENRSLSYDVIGKFLCRDSRSLAVTYGVARRKMPEFFSSRVDRDVVRVPFSVFSFGLSVLESVCFHLKFLGYSYVDISRLIGRDPTTVWTVCKRAEKKRGSVNAREKNNLLDKNVDNNFDGGNLNHDG